MAVILLDTDRLSRDLQSLPACKRGAFAASCAQRLAGCFLDNLRVQEERPDDIRLAQRVLDRLWAVTASDSSSHLESLIMQLERMPELTAYNQWQGRGAYQTHALAAMLYAARVWGETTPNYVVQCAQCTFDAAASLDARLDPEPVEPLEALRALIDEGISVPDPPSGPFQPRELQRQREDLAAITAALPDEWETILLQIRGTSQAYSLEFRAALESTFI